MSEFTERLSAANLAMNVGRVNKMIKQGLSTEAIIEKFPRHTKEEVLGWIDICVVAESIKKTQN